MILARTIKIMKWYYNKYPNISKALIDGPYKKQALIPASPWLSKKAPVVPDVQVISEGEKSLRILHK